MKKYEFLFPTAVAIIVCALSLTCGFMLGRGATLNDICCDAGNKLEICQNFECWGGK